jgi:hypothetical protein
LLCEFSSCHGCDYQDNGLFECDVVKFDRWLLKFGRNLLLSTSIPKMEQAGFSHNFVPVFQTKRRVFPEGESERA